MNEKTNVLEALKMISDWSKWLITIETGAISIIGAVIGSERFIIPNTAKGFATTSIVCFLISIAVAAILLLSLPEITQFVESDTNIWLTRDSMIGRVFRMNTQSLAVWESFFFGAGMICFSALIIVLIWLPAVP